MSDEHLRPIRVLHLVSAGGVTSAMQQSLFMPLLTRLPKQRVKTQVVSLAPGAVPAAVLRQNGVPVHEVGLSRQRFTFGALKEIVQAVAAFRPDVIQAWGHTAQIASVFVRSRCEWKPKLVWNTSNTAPLPRNAGFIDQQKFKWAAKLAARADQHVYASDAGASQHRRSGFPEGGHITIPPGVDAARFKPDLAARRKVREQLQTPPKSFVVGMVAPFQPENDFATLLKALGELIKTNPELSVVLAGHGVQKGNAPLMALVGGGALGTRTHLLGEWSDAASLFNACDVVCSSALHDNGRMTLIGAMLCGVPCVATGMGAQGEVLGQFGVAVEPGSPAAFVKGITRIMQLPLERRQHMVQGARKHALKEYVYVRSLQKYLQLYFDLVGREALAAEVVAAPVVDADEPIPAPVHDEDYTPPTPKKAMLEEMADPDSLEAKVAEQSSENLPKWRLEQEQKRAEQDAKLTPTTQTEGDVLELFETQVAAAEPKALQDPDRAGAPEEDLGELLAPDVLASAAPLEHRAPTPTPRVRKSEESAEEPRKMDAMERMRAAARQELQRAAAAQVNAAAPTESPKVDAQELKLDLAPDEPLKRASG